MSERRAGRVRGGVCFLTIVALAACGGAAKQAESPTGGCPEGTVLRGNDCVPPEGESAKEAAQERAMESSGSTKNKPDEGSSSASAPAGLPAKTPYDRDAVEAELKRGARQVKANCGAATDDEGKATGPWGRTKAGITLGRNGHVRQVVLPAPYDGKPVAICVAHAFDKIQFPPYAGDTDLVVEWDVDLVRPKGR